MPPKSDIEKQITERPGSVAEAAMAKVLETNKQRRAHDIAKEAETRELQRQELSELTKKAAALSEKHSAIDIEIEAKRALERQEAKKEAAPEAIPLEEYPEAMLDEVSAQGQQEQQEPQTHSSPKVTPTPVTNNPTTTLTRQPQLPQERTNSQYAPMAANSFLSEIGKKGIMLFFLEKLVDNFIQGIKKIFSSSPRSESGTQKNVSSSRESLQSSMETVSNLRSGLIETCEEYKKKMTERRNSFNETHKASREQQNEGSSHAANNKPKH